MGYNASKYMLFHISAYTEGLSIMMVPMIAKTIRMKTWITLNRINQPGKMTMIMKHQNTSETLDSANPATIGISGNVQSLEKPSLKLHILFHYWGGLRALEEMTPRS